MTALRKRVERSGHKLVRRTDYVVDYSQDVTEEDVRKIDDLLKDEFKTGNWVPVDEES